MTKNQIITLRFRSTLQRCEKLLEGQPSLKYSINQAFMLECPDGNYPWVKGILQALKGHLKVWWEIFLTFWAEPQALHLAKTGTAYQLANNVPVVKHDGGKIMLWCCFSVAGMWRLIESLHHSAHYLPRTGVKVHLWAWQCPVAYSQGNSGLTSWQVSECPWLAIQSPDLNLIEHVWRDLAIHRLSLSNLM